MTAASPAGWTRPFALGMANGDIPNDPAGFSVELAKSWRVRGLACVALGFSTPADQLDIARMREIRTMLEDQGIHVAELAGVNANLVHPDPGVRDQAVERVRAAIPPATAIGSAIINSGPGSCSAGWRESFYRADADNFTEAAEDRAVDTLTRIAELIDDSDLSYVIECHVLTTMRSPVVIRRLLDRVDHPRILANFDPVNLLDSAYVAYTNADRIPEFVDTVGPRYAHTCHVKDVTVTDAMPFESHEAPPGHGLVEIETIFAAAQRLPGDRPIDLIVEHLDPKNAEASVELVRQRAVAAGIPLV